MSAEPDENKSAAPQIIAGDIVYGDQTAGDKVGGDKIAVGDIGGSYNAIGAGAQVNVTQVQEALSAVDAHPSQSPYGCYDMVGNGREWTTTLWGDAPREPDEWYRYPWAADGRRDNLHAPPTTRRVFRGGRGEGEAAYYCSNRGALLPDQSGPRRNRHGFRVVLINAAGSGE